MQFFWGQVIFKKIQVISLLLGPHQSPGCTSLCPMASERTVAVSITTSLLVLQVHQSLIFRFFKHVSNSVSYDHWTLGLHQALWAVFLKSPVFLNVEKEEETPPLLYALIVTQYKERWSGIQELWALVWVLILTHCVSLGNFLFHSGPCFSGSVKERCWTRFIQLCRKCQLNPYYVPGTVWVLGISREQTRWPLGAPSALTFSDAPPKPVSIHPQPPL